MEGELRFYTHIELSKTTDNAIDVTAKDTGYLIGRIVASDTGFYFAPNKHYVVWLSYEVMVEITDHMVRLRQAGRSHK